jgi:hypothetical protein
MTVALAAMEIGQQRIGWRYLVVTQGGLPIKLEWSPYPCLSIAIDKLAYLR